MKWLLIISVMIVFLVGCNLPEGGNEEADTPDEVVLPKLPDKLVAHVKSMDLPPVEKTSVLSALIVLVQAGMIAEYQWTPPTTGTPVVYYETETLSRVSTNSIYVLRAVKTNILVRVRGVDAAERTGPWSSWSDTLQVLPVLP